MKYVYIFKRSSWLQLKYVNFYLFLVQNILTQVV